MDILYQLGGKFNFLTLIPFFIFIIFLMCGIFLPKIKKLRENERLSKLAKSLPNAFALCTLTVTLIFAVFDVIEYKTLMTAVTEDKMVYAEGVVTDYTICKNKTEKFKIGNTEFDINPNKFNYGYNVSFTNGSVIKEGENLKIGYVDYNGEKKIVYIEKILRSE